jgi:Tol biopolymer transport system component
VRPKSRRIVFIGIGGFFEIDPDGGNPRLLAAKFGAAPTWSHDDRAVIFNSIGERGLREIDIATGRVRTLTSDSDASPVVAPDVSIIFSRATDELHEHYALFRLDTQARLHQLSDGQNRDEAPDVSSDGRFIAFTRETGEGDLSAKIRSSEIFILDTLTQRLRRLTRNAELDQDPAWRPGHSPRRDAAA